MAQVINTNVMSLTAQRNLNKTQSSLSQSLQRLSSGLRINSAKDDAAGLAIANRFTAQINGLNQAVRNANDGISMAQTAEGAMDEITTAMQRIRELAVQSANGSYSSGDRTNLQEEVDQLTAEINRIITNTDFNGTSVLNSGSAVTFQVGANSNQTISLTTSNLSSSISAGAAGTAGEIDISTASAAQTAIDTLDTDIDAISSERATYGALQSRFESAVRNLQNIAENMSASNSRIMDADFASETASLTRAQILQQAGTAMLAQANAAPQSVLSLLG